jgi:hypothetical protein
MARASTPQGDPVAPVGRESTSGAPSAGRGRGFLRRHGRAIPAVVGVAAIAGFIQFVVPQLSALGPTLHRLRAGDPKWLGFGAIAYCGFDIATLWTCFHAFGSPPPVAVIVMAYFVGALANALPLPGGLGGVEAGMIGAFLAFLAFRHARQPRDPRGPLLPAHLFLAADGPGRSRVSSTASDRRRLEERDETAQANN